METGRVIAVRTRKIIYHDGDTTIKVFDTDYPKAAILNEACNQARMEETSIPIPRIKEIKKIGDKWAILSEYIPGRNMEQLMQHEPERSEEYVKILVDLQCRIFREKAPLLNRLKDAVNRKIAQCDLEATARYDLHARMEDIPKRHSICHGDFQPSNIIFTPQDEIYILDWAHVTQGDPAADIAITYLYFHMSNKPEMAVKYLSMICAERQIEEKEVLRWVPMIAAAQSVGKPQEEKEQWIQFVK